MKNGYYDNNGKLIIYITTYCEFKNIFNKFNESDYYYRGQSDPYWLLESPFDRLCKKLIKIDKNIEEELMLTKFINNKKHCDNLENNSILNIIAIMQHYGAHTRFIDFTTCPFITTYFAIRGFNLSKDESDIYTSSVYMINKKIVNKNKIPEKLKEPIINDTKFKEIMIDFKKFSSEEITYIYSYEPNIPDRM